MKLKIITLSVLGLFTTLSWGQTLLYNDGATIKIQAGATLYVEGGVQNTATGTIDNDGIIEIKGDFENLGTWEASQPNTLKFSGTTASNVTSASGVAYQDVVVAKTGANVVLLSNMTVNDSLVFSGTGVSNLENGTFDVKLGPDAKAGGYDSDEYIVMTGTGGVVEKSVAANGTFEFPVGDATNYSPLTSVYTGTAYTAATIRTKVTDATHPNKPADATEYISRYWDVDAAGITDYTNLLTGTYVPADLTLGTGGTAAQVKGAVYDGVEWSYAGASTSGSTVTGSTTDLLADFSGTNFFGRVNIIAYLNGAYNATTGVMSTTLNTAGIIPLISPYLDAPDTVVSIPAGVTDWVKLELRDTGSPTTILGKASAFIKSDGTIVGTDGVSLPTIKNGNQVSIVNVLHRNHLPIRTPNTGLDVVNPTLYDFSLSLANAYDNPAVLTNDAMRLMTNGKYVMWGGNANGNINVRYTTGSGDEAYLLGTVLMGNTALIITGPAAYNGADMNMNANIRYTTGSGDEAFLLGNVLGGNTATIINQHQ